jgi:pseudouridine-5'-phosphate glycosidase
MNIHYSEEVQEARAAGRPLVAMETSVVAQGLPYPQNLEAARACEEAVRAAGAVSAPTAVIEGRVHVGLTVEQMRRLAEPAPGRLKLGSRELAVAVARRADGGTTVSATCEIAAAAGIQVFATGGIGGVHRELEVHLDISQDLGAIARHPVAVVCAGAKSVLDLPRTLEVLETLGVPVFGIGTEDFPAFYSRTSGLKLPFALAGVQEAAEVVRARFDALGQGGLVLALPPPEDTALPRAEVERLILLALDEARRQNVVGQAVTPYLLSRLAALSEGRTLTANLALLVHNARFAGELAVQLTT